MSSYTTLAYGRLPPTLGVQTCIKKETVEEFIMKKF
jgi:hypothetical protein